MGSGVGVVKTRPPPYERIVLIASITYKGRRHFVAAGLFAIFGESEISNSDASGLAHALLKL